MMILLIMKKLLLILKLKLINLKLNQLLENLNLNNININNNNYNKNSNNNNNNKNICLEINLVELIQFKNLNKNLINNQIKYLMININKCMMTLLTCQNKLIKIWNYHNNKFQNIQEVNQMPQITSLN